MAGSTATARGIEVRRKLLVAAAGLIPELGWNAVTTRNLADRAGVAPGLVHYHFRSLQALLREAAMGAMREVLAELAPMTEGAEPADVLDALIGHLDTYTGEDQTTLLFVETYLVATRDEALRGELADFLRGFNGDLARWLATHGYSTPAETAGVLAAAIDGVLLHRTLNPALTARAVAPVLRRLLTDETSEEVRPR